MVLSSGRESEGGKRWETSARVAVASREQWVARSTSGARSELHDVHAFATHQQLGGDGLRLDPLQTGAEGSGVCTRCRRSRGEAAEEGGTRRERRRIHETSLRM